MSSNRFSVADQTRQSHPIDPSEPFNLSWVRGKTIVITGGASGFGASFFKKWATAGANVIIGDVDDAKGESIVRTVRTATDNRNHHYLHCDVTDWQSQVNFFKQASKLSPHGGIDAVVANAGVADVKAKFNEPENLDMDYPPKPDMRVLDVNLVGVLYTTHLALFYLPRNPGSEPADPNKTAKHGVLGLFRSLRITAFTKGVRVNMVCPYFVDTGILTPPGRMLLAGTNLAQVEDVVEAGSRLMADSRISGRNLVVGPRLSIVKTEQGEWQYCRQEDNQNAMEVSLWEVHTDDLETSDVFMRRVVGLMNAAQEMRGWILWTKDMAKVLFDMVKTAEWRETEETGE
ncbi:hypothetical protein V1522DRAFT_444804 [Lipomyces starkeyi]